MTAPQRLEGTLVVTAVVTNIGDVAGDEIARLYVRDIVGVVTRPVKELKGFHKLFLTPGQSKQVTFEAPVHELGFHGLDMAYKVAPGDFQVWVGPDSARGLEGSFTL